MLMCWMAKVKGGIGESTGGWSNGEHPSSCNARQVELFSSWRHRTAREALGLPSTRLQHEEDQGSDPQQGCPATNTSAQRDHKPTYDIQMLHEKSPHGLLSGRRQVRRAPDAGCRIAKRYWRWAGNLALRRPCGVEACGCRHGGGGIGLGADTPESA